CRMPGMSGYALTQAIRRAEAEAGRLPVPIFGCSANGQAEEAERCREAGMNQLLVKPLELQALGRLLASLGVPPAFDMDTLRRMTQADAEVMRRMLEELQRNIAQELEGLASAVSKADWPALRAALHRLKGVACLIDAAPMAKACAALDVSAREQRAQALEDEWAALHARLDELAEDIERQLWEMSYPK
uniref:Hpt domain-containing protein n=1 Tax=Pseudomonas sp. TaxID=306 RepID=UPI0025895A2F